LYFLNNIKTNFMKNSKLILINNLLFFFILFFNFDVNSQTQGFELQYGTGGWYEKNKKELPEIENQIYWNNNIKIGYKILPFISFGLSTNYNFDKYYSKSNHILLPDKTLFEEYKIKDKKFGLGPYFKLSIGKNFIFSLKSEIIYSYGKINHNISTDFQNHIDYQNYNIDYTSKVLSFELSLGKKIFNNLYLFLFFDEQYCFFKKIQKNITDSYFQHFVGINLNYTIT